MITKRQQQMIEALKTVILKEDGHGDITRYEYKEFTVKEYSTFVVLATEVGLTNDEGKLSSVFCRTRRLIAIGKRGGLTLLNPARFVCKNGQTEKVPAANKTGFWNCVHSATC